MPLRWRASDRDNGRQLAEALRALEEVPASAARTAADASRLRPALLSQLQQDDAKADPYHLSHAVSRSLSTSVDHLVPAGAAGRREGYPMYPLHPLAGGA